MLIHDDRSFSIVPYQPDHLAGIVRLTLRAWAPVYQAVEQFWDPELYQHFYPDWRETQRQSVEACCKSPENTVWVAVDGSEPLGFIAAKLHDDDQIGEVYMIGVDPDAQRRGIARSLMEVAEQWIRESGRSVAMVETGGDPGHSPARAFYESDGYKPWPSVRYFKKL